MIPCCALTGSSANTGSLARRHPPVELKRMAERMGCHAAMLLLTKAQVDRAFKATKKK
jgi:hypothetical protein